jgi:hypothetical protein
VRVADRLRGLPGWRYAQVFHEKVGLQVLGLVADAAETGVFVRSAGGGPGAELDEVPGDAAGLVVIAEMGEEVALQACRHDHVSLGMYREEREGLKADKAGLRVEGGDFFRGIGCAPGMGAVLGVEADEIAGGRFDGSAQEVVRVAQATERGHTAERHAAEAHAVEVEGVLPDGIGKRFDHFINLGDDGGEDVRGRAGIGFAMVAALAVAGKVDGDGGEPGLNPADEATRVDLLIGGASVHPDDGGDAVDPIGMDEKGGNVTIPPAPPTEADGAGTLGE